MNNKWFSSSYEKREKQKTQKEEVKKQQQHWPMCV